MWLLPVLMRIVVGHAFVPWMIKKNGTKSGREERFLIQFATATFLAICGALILGATVDVRFFVVVGIGFINGFGAYCQWRAVEISLSKKSMFTWGDDLIAMALAYHFLGEGRVLNALMIIGIGFSFAAVALFSYNDYRKDRRDKEVAMPASHLALYGWIAGYSVIWGMAIFCTRLMAKEEMGASNFMTAWYSGALLAATLIVCLKRHRERLVITWSSVIPGFGLGCAIFIALGLNYWSFALAPLLVVQSLFLVSEMVVPTMIGLFGFNERKGYNLVEWCYLGISGIGAGLIITGFTVS